MGKRSSSKNIPKRILTSIGKKSAEKFVLRCQDCQRSTVREIVRVGDVVPCFCGVYFDIVNYRAVSDPDELADWLNSARSYPVCATDVETMSPLGNHFDMYSGKLVGVSFSVNVGEAIYVPLCHAVGENMEYELFKELVTPFIRDHSLIVHNAAGMEWPWFYLTLKVEPNIVVDTIIVSWMDDPNRVHRFDPRSVALKAMAKELWDIRVTEYSDLVSKDQNFGYLDVRTATPYGCQDSDLTLRLHSQLTDGVRTNQPFIFKMEHELIPHLARMKLRGFKLNSKFLVEGNEEIQKEVAQLEYDTFELMGENPPPVGTPEWDVWERPFELGSPKRVSQKLFFEMGLPYDPRSVGKSGVPPANKSSLGDLRDEYPVVEKLLSYREAEHMANSFLRSLPKFVNPVTGYVHHSVNQTGAPTGRFSHSAPNTAQIPKKRD